MCEYVDSLIDDNLSYIRDCGFGFNTTMDNLIYLAVDGEIFKWDDIKYDIIPFLILLNNFKDIRYIGFRMKGKLMKLYYELDDVVDEKFDKYDLDLNKIDLMVIGY